MFGEQPANFRNGAILIVRKDLSKNRRPARPIALVLDLLVRDASSSPVPFLIALSMLSLGILWALAVATAVRSRGLALMSPPPIRAATLISLMSLVKSFPLLASFAAFLCLIELHFE